MEGSGAIYQTHTTCQSPSTYRLCASTQSFPVFEAEGSGEVTRSRAVDWTRLLRTFLEVLRSAHIFPTTGKHGTSLLLLRDPAMRVPALLVSLLAGLLGVCGEPSTSARGLIAQSAQLEVVVGPIGPRPTVTLSTVAEDYTTLVHAEFPHHAVRIARVHDFCDPTVRCANPYHSLRLF
jgi:hypothetical protein